MERYFCWCSTRIYILVPLMFSIYINDMFLSADNAFLKNYADETTLYWRKSRITEIL